MTTAVTQAPARPSDSDPDLAPGTVVGEYVVARKLGQGGFGAVFEASHPVIGKVVALKVLSRRFSVDDDMVERFIDEARAVNTIRHRNIIDIFSFGQLEDGRRYYVMEHLDGEPLDVLLEHRGKLPLGEALPILRGIARALDAAHAKGVAHRDLKPENVFLGRDEEGAVFPKLLDFGIAKLTHGDHEHRSRTATGVPLGTPRFMSPEQCRGRDVDHRTDLYAFGVLMYRMLTGVFPIDGEDYMSTLLAQMNDDPLPPSTHVPELPPIIDQLIAALMHKEAAQRPKSCGVVIRALETSSLADLGVRIPIETTTSRGVPMAAVSPTTIGATPPRRRASLLAAMLGGGVVVAAIVAIVAVRGGSSDAEAPAPVPPATPEPAKLEPAKPAPEPAKPAPEPAKPAPEPPAPPKPAPARSKAEVVKSRTSDKPIPRAGSGAPATKRDDRDIEDPFKR